MHTLSSRLTLTARLLFQYGVGLGYYSNMASCSVAIPTWCWSRALSFGPTNYKQCLHLSEWVSDTFAYQSPCNKHVSTLHVYTSLKTGQCNGKLLVLVCQQSQRMLQSLIFNYRPLGETIKVLHWVQMVTFLSCDKGISIGKHCYTWTTCLIASLIIAYINQRKTSVNCDF